MTIRGVIFDMGGTLAPPSAFMEAKVAGLLEWAQTRGLSISAETAEVVASAHRWLWEETFATGRQYTTPEAMARAAQQLGWPLNNASLNEASRVFHLPEAARRPYADAIPSLEFLKRKGLRLAVISDHSDQWLVEYILTYAGLRRFFDPVVSSATFGRIKPDPGIFGIVLDSWRCSPRECVMVGDTLEADIAGGRAVGMRTILVTMDPSPRNARFRTPVHPDATAASLSDVVTIIRTWID